VTAIPVLVPPAPGQTWRPWLTPAMFTAYPHWLDLDNLIPGGLASVQEDVLADVLLAATDWAVGELGEMRLEGHLVSGESQTARVLPDGRVTLMPRDVPLRAIISLSAGWDPASLSAVTLPDPTMRFTAGGRVVSFSACSVLGSSSLVPSSRVRWGGDLYFNWSYIAGYPSALLPSAVLAGATSVTVDDPAGILPGDVLRIYDPGASEALNVASTFAPVLPTIPPTATAIPLASAVQHEHLTGTGVTGFPRKALQAVIAYGVALLLRDDVSEEEPASPFGPAARTTGLGRGGQGGGLVNDAYEWLSVYKQYVRRG
jgi:hypothetical protein